MKIFDIMTTFLSLFIILLYLYFRLFKNHDTILLHKDELKDNLDIFISLLIITSTILLGLIILLVLQNKLKKNTKSPYLIKIGKWFSKFNIFYKTYGIIFEFLGPMNTQYLVFFTSRFLEWSSQTKLWLILFCVTLPRFFIILVLIIEIYFGQLYYYFYSLLLLLVPIIFAFVVFILNDIGPRVLPQLREFIEIDTNVSEIEIELPTGKKKFKPIGFRFKPEHSAGDIDTFMFYFYNPMSFISGEMQVNFLPIYTFVKQMTIITYLIIHVFAWSYIILLCLV